MRAHFVSVILVVWAQHGWAADGLSDREVDSLQETEVYSDLEEMFDAPATPNFWRDVFLYTHDLLGLESTDPWADFENRGSAGGIRG